MQDLSSKSEHKRKKNGGKSKYETCASNAAQFGATRQSMLQMQTDLSQTCSLKNVWQTYSRYRADHKYFGLQNQYSYSHIFRNEVPWTLKYSGTESGYSGTCMGTQ